MADAWTAVKTWVSELLTSSDLNTYIRDNLTNLDRRTTMKRGVVSYTEATSSLTFTDLATIGPSATATVGTSGLVLVILTCLSYNDTAGAGAQMGFAISGAHTQAADDNFCLQTSAPSALQGWAQSAVFPLNNITPGLCTFSAKFRALSAGNAYFDNKFIAAIPLGA